MFLILLNNEQGVEVCRQAGSGPNSGTNVGYIIFNYL